MKTDFEKATNDFQLKQIQRVYFEYVRNNEPTYIHLFVMQELIHTYYNNAYTIEDKHGIEKDLANIIEKYHYLDTEIIKKLKKN